MNFSKRHGLGNDFLIQLVSPSDQGYSSKVAEQLCDRRRGIGADGLIVGTVDPHSPDTAQMVLYNSDGSRAEMSGNGIRCLAHAMYDSHFRPLGISEQVFSISTDVGVKKVDLRSVSDLNEVYASVDMGPIGSVVVDQKGIWVDMGNPHLVIFCEEADHPDPDEVAKRGHALQDVRPGGINVEWVSVSDAANAIFKMSVYERGVGPTFACGTGSCASFLAARHLALTKDKATIVNPGGPLDLEVTNGRLILGGPSRVICDVSSVYFFDSASVGDQA